ncbi:MAG: hypothetical protein EPN23_10175 [Verrucomicrobia bacterium]|nr:MAG: hypothetical protein EPN23_10175 [Verrucomicrobiota bacterium]
MVYPKNITRACCVCHRVQQGESWVTPGLREKPAAVLSHTYCPECYGRVMAAMKLPLLSSPMTRRAGTLAVA